MFINDVIRQVDNYYPNEYDATEKYLWCDEVSSMLAIEDRQCFIEKKLPVSDEGTILLPDNLGVEYIDKIIYKNRELTKQDSRTFGKREINIKGYNNRVETEADGTDGGFATVIYLVPYQPIRLIKYNGLIEIDKENSKIMIGDCEFISGDLLNIFKADPVLVSIPLLGVNYEDRGGNNYILTVPTGTLDELEETEFEGLINRSVVEKTVCDAPFDGMYVDYLLAKINMYQRDMNAYNQHMTAFNSRLAAYKMWLNERWAKDDGKFTNWW